MFWNISRDLLKGRGNLAYAISYIAAVGSLAAYFFWRPQERATPEGGILGAVLHFFIVVALTLLWFRTFLLVHAHDAQTAPSVQRVNVVSKKAGEAAVAKRKKWVLFFASLLPALGYGWAMIHTPEPAIFVLAVVAIFVAAEHYGGLTRAEKKLEDTEDRLREINDKIYASVSELQSLQSGVATLMNADGMKVWRQRMYDQYAKSAQRVDAVLRHFDIDPIWWEQDAGLTAADIWSAYRKKAGNGDALTLWLTLTKAKCTAFQFVAELPMPSKVSSDEASFFRNLLGLAWQLAVIADVNETRRRQLISQQQVREALQSNYARIVISTAPAWMHVVDNVTYQALERPTMERSTFRELTQDIERERDKVRTSEWARRNISDFASRGMPAKEYLLSTLRFGAFSQSGANEEWDIDSTLLQILHALGLEAYLNSPNNDDFQIIKEKQIKERHDKFQIEGPKLVYKDAETLCLSIFKVFLSTVKVGHGLKLHDLAREVL